jgi:hypothetical protein
VQTAVAFLTTPVRNPDKDNYKKMARCMKYLRATINLPLTLEADELQMVHWWVDASFAVHPDMKSHTGATMSIGKGSIYSKSTRQKLNTKSSTEAELVGVDDLMPQVLWTKYFLEAQGYVVKEYQDNKTTRAPCCLPRMEEAPAGSGQGTSTYATSLYRTESSQKK